MLTAYLSLSEYLSRKRNRAEGGAAAVEYALLAALIALAIVAAVTLLGTKMAAVFDAIRTAIP